MRQRLRLKGLQAVILVHAHRVWGWDGRLARARWQSI